jgi:transcriptional regulator with XRE-family HTH domain
MLDAIFTEGHYQSGNGPRPPTGSTLLSMDSVSTAPKVGRLLRAWRQRRNLSQLALASDSAVSTRYLSFIETGRARPSREMITHLAEQLEVPLRERNALLMAAGYAPIYGARSLDEPSMEQAREAIDRFLEAHEPYPALVADRHWNMVAANEAVRVFTDGVAPELLEPPANIFRIALHPEGIAPRILNLPEWSGAVMQRLRRHAAVSGDPEIRALYEELSQYPSIELSRPEGDGAQLDPTLVHRFVLADEDGGELSLFSTVTTFGTASDVTLAELSIEAFYPADTATRTALQKFAERQQHGVTAPAPADR